MARRLTVEVAQEGDSQRIVIVAFGVSPHHTPAAALEHGAVPSDQEAGGGREKVSRAGGGTGRTAVRGHSLVSDVIKLLLGLVVSLDAFHAALALLQVGAGPGVCVVDDHSLDDALQKLLLFSGLCIPVLPGDDGH